VQKEEREDCQQALTQRHRALQRITHGFTTLVHNYIAAQLCHWHALVKNSIKLLNITLNALLTTSAFVAIAAPLASFATPAACATLAPLASSHAAAASTSVAIT
jgi:hypothetical protein